MVDQAEDIRQRLEALQNKQQSGRNTSAISPTTEIREESNRPLSPKMENLVKQRKLEAAIDNIANAQPVVVVDVKMKFGSMVAFMVKWAFAAIPAFLIISVIVWGFFAVMGTLLFHR